MCFIIDSHFPDALIADRDIPCMKILSKHWFSRLSSPVTHYDYRFGKTYNLNKSLTVEKRVDTNYVTFTTYYEKCINEGFHSYDTFIVVPNFKKIN